MIRDVLFGASLAAVIAAVIAAGLVFTNVYDNEYYFNFAYIVLQGMVVAIAWNILGGFAGYVNFGSAGFFAVGAYTAIALNKLAEPPLVVLILAVAIVCETLIDNWEYVGGAGGTYIIPPETAYFFDNYVEYLFFVMLMLAVIATAVSRLMNRSKLGRGLAAIREDETAAECAGVPTLRLKLIATTVMGALMGPRARLTGSMRPMSIRSPPSA